MAGALSTSTLSITQGEAGRVKIDVPYGEIVDKITKSPTEGNVDIVFVSAALIADVDSMVTASVGTLKKTTVAAKALYQNADANPVAFADVADKVALVAEADASFGTLL